MTKPDDYPTATQCRDDLKATAASVDAAFDAMGRDLVARITVELEKHFHSLKEPP